MKNSIFNKKSLIIVIVLFAFTIGLSLFLYSNSEVEKYVESLPSTEELNELYSSVIERNRTMLKNPIEYGDKYCSGYISVKNDLKLHTDILNELQKISDSICKNKENDYDKVTAIAYYTAENIYYNHIAANDSVTAEIISLEYVLDTKTATCAGYSNLFSALCNMQGIYCVNLRGGSNIIHYDTSENLLNAPINHEWNAVLIDDEWFFIDTTWLSNNKYTENGYEKADNFDEQYLIMSLEEMSYEHRIDIIDYRNFKTSINALK